jgi:hypothetical protein
MRRHGALNAREQRAADDYAAEIGEKPDRPDKSEARGPAAPDGPTGSVVSARLL